MPIFDPHSMEFISHGVEQTRRVGMRLGALLRQGDVICLSGDLGSGKTTLVQGLAAGWGSLDAVSSPTFVLVNVYRRSEDPHQRLYHLDAYRLSGPAEAEDLDLDSMFENGPLVIEWAERIQAALPPEHLWIGMQYIDDAQRDLLFTARGPRYQAMLDSIRRRIYGVAR
jgi:tRNA threonylcarbamoyladenosine biosynthesis protein TsaE